MKTVQEYANKCLHEMNFGPLSTTQCMAKWLELYATEREGELRKEIEELKGKITTKDDRIKFLEGQDGTPFNNLKQGITKLQSENARLREVAEKCKKTLQSIGLSLMVHPDCANGSEFADMVAMTVDTIESLNTKADD